MILVRGEWFCGRGLHPRLGSCGPLGLLRGGTFVAGGLAPSVDSGFCADKAGCVGSAASFWYIGGRE